MEIALVVLPKQDGCLTVNFMAIPTPCCLTYQAIVTFPTNNQEKRLPVSKTRGLISVKMICAPKNHSTVIENAFLMQIKLAIKSHLREE
jgi:hypothetical protein